MSEQNNTRKVTVDGGNAVAHIAYRVSDICSIYPITPSSDMSELSDLWATQGIKNIWGQVPQVIEMQSEGGAAGTAHGALQTGALTTTFTASQGLLLMLPNMYKIAGELTSSVFHVAARSIAAQALSIFGDHQDVMAARMTGFAMLASNSVQEAHDAALITHAATLKARVPFINFFDGFRTSHEINKISLITDDQIREMISEEMVFAHRNRALNPDNPFIRGTAQNPDVYFQGRESSNPYYDTVPEIVQETMDELARLTGRQYHLFDYYGAEDAEEVVVMMGSGAQTVEQTIDEMNANGRKLGLVMVRLFRPFSMKHLLGALPKSCKKIAVLDRTKEPGGAGEPLYQDVITGLAEALGEGMIDAMPRVIGGRYGLSSKEFTPAMARAVFDNLAADNAKNHFTVGINDDVTHSSIEFDHGFDIEPDNVTRAMFFGLGSDGTVSANKNSIKIIGESTDLYCQGYFVYDSKKAGSQTTSHLRFGPDPIKAPYLITSANFIACHKYNFIDQVEMLDKAADKAVFLLNSPVAADKVWDDLPEPVQQQIIDKNISFYVIDATTVARNAGMGRRINTIMQTCFFALSGVLPRDEAIANIKAAIEKTYMRKGQEIVDLNFKAVDASLDHLHQVEVPERISSSHGMKPSVSVQAPTFVQEVTAPMLAGRGDDLPVSMIPVDGTYPSGTARWEKRNIADFVPKWEPDVCIQCGNCSFVCPHSVIRARFYHEDTLNNAPATFESAPVSARGFPESRYTLQIYVEDCTGCGLCVEACPAYDQNDDSNSRKAINMMAKEPDLDEARANIDFFDTIPVNKRSTVNFASVRGAQFLEPLFEFSGACAGCGETPYVRLLTQLFGPRLLVANATGCSSIYGGNLPATPWSTNREGRGPAWSNSLFEDNAEFGLGMRVSADQQLVMAKDMLSGMTDHFDQAFIDSLMDTSQEIGTEMHQQRERVKELKRRLETIDDPKAKALLTVADHLVRRSVWLVGGDGWAYDIGSGGLDHALASGRNINVLVLDTEVYSNTGGQASKSTPIAATAKFAAAGKAVTKKDLALQAISYGNVYVARVAFGANPQQTLQAMREAEAYPGPSIILAYSPCIAHGIDLRDGLSQQEKAVESGYWPLLRYNPQRRKAGLRPFILDSTRPSIPLEEFAYNEQRYKLLQKNNADAAAKLMKLAQESLDLRWQTYEHMAEQEPAHFQPVG
ncbi:pyruvate:ferredoxin (flavodoxin) oxidoreductase [Solemya pervernicosa gill symbiont]|uniref:Pyruvate-flavodoxin oxidoreductase n=2 Tax=Gammaproteobacteria incertae sedis TaxID=118884 RepID=A0A1T2L655_9GAMM|nr:pyruvate:ferredoxin (flavodoxin) oxidoreductase [Candidatus Reidiella endopervernicosa]OOZ40563.1 pyruvate:ferredoxin (flavodoxin) oxidoreductase [Solemya pervernicosa gill symbiont]QKQ27611.1 pyruvate:ferredoxin (flavodoxin) oxidoreductase [Candidatus Reidiella endopervernicosa]